MVRLLFVVLGALPFLCSCAPLSSGAKYTFARVAMDQTLAPVKGPLEANGDQEHNPKIVENMGIVLNGGYLRYLTAIGRPEVVIFAKVKVREPDEPEESLVWEKIYLLSEDASNQMVLNKDSFLPRLDIPILPGIKYQDQEVYVSLRIVELDQADNERVKALVSTAAAAGSVFRPDAAVGVSVLQAVMNFITGMNADDIEFQFDFAIVPNERQVNSGKAWSSSGKSDLVLQPRVGKYVLVKTEHRMRENLPSNTLEMVPLSIRYTLGMALRYATLGIVNWRVWERFGTDREDDFYQRIVGRAAKFQGRVVVHVEDGRMSF